MLTEIGKELRKLRIDQGERLFDMAGKLGKSPAFLSAIEVGRKSPPDDLANAVIETYRLTGDHAKRIRQAVDRSRKNFKLEANSPFERDTAALLARKFNSLSDAQLQDIVRILRGEGGTK